MHGQFVLGLAKTDDKILKNVLETGFSRIISTLYPWCTPFENRHHLHDILAYMHCCSEASTISKMNQL